MLCLNKYFQLSSSTCVSTFYPVRHFGFTTVLDTVLEPSIENMTYLCLDIMMKIGEGKKRVVLRKISYLLLENI